MSKNPPYMTSHGRINFILDKIKHAKTPDRFTNDFLKTVIGAKASNDRPFIGLAKRIELLNQDGSPTDLYKKFRSTDTNVSKAAMAEAIKIGFTDIYALNEYAHKLTNTEVEGLVIQLTGLEKNNKICTSIVKTFVALKEFADFDITTDNSISNENDASESDNSNNNSSQDNNHALPNLSTQNMQLGLSYQINLILPKTDDIAVFNAIFKSLKENLLDK
jgi:Family of unknown function (DUF5343)